MQIAFKVDVDTRKGLVSGCPNLLKIFRGAGVNASFFIPMGPDRTGMTITRVFKNPRILEKAKRTNVFEIYGFPTLLYGTLLPSPSIITGNESTLLQILEEDHEIGVHGYDHFRWQDFIDCMDEKAIVREIGKAFSVFKRIFNRGPKSFAAPGWHCSQRAWNVLDDMHFLYTSNTRGRSIYYPDFNGWISATLEIPTTLPTLDEMRIPKTEETINRTIDTCLEGLSDRGLNVYTLHAEIEGIISQDFLERFVEALKARGAEFLCLEDIAKKAISEKDSIEKANVVYRKVSGRTTPVACQS